MPEARFVVYRCSKCGHVQASPLRYSSKRCPYCGQVNKLSEVQILAYASNAEDAAAIAARLKEAEASRTGMASAEGST